MASFSAYAGFSVAWAGNFSFAMPFVHIAITISIWWLFINGFSAWLRRRPGSPALRALFALLATTLFLFQFVFLFLGNLLAQANWGSNLNVEVIAKFLPQWHVLLTNLRYSQNSVLPWIATIGVLCIALPAWFAWRNSAGLHLGDGRQNPRRDLASWLVPLAILGLAASSAPLSPLQGEPWLSLASPNRFFSYPTAKSLAIKDRDARRSYHASPAKRPHVILIVVDALRASNTSAYGYARKTTPYLDQAVASGRLIRVENARSSTSGSLSAIPALLASRQVEFQHPHNFKIHELLAGLGWTTRFILAGDHHWYGLRQFYGPQVDHYSDGNNFSPLAIGDDRGVLKALQALPAASTPTFFYIHLMSVHEAGVRLPKYRRFVPDQRALSGPQNALHHRNFYDNSILQADAMIRDVFSILEKKGYLDDSIGALTADHGEGLGEHGVIGHFRDLYEPQIRVPLFFFGLQAKTIVDSNLATSLDVAPTLIAALGLPLPETWQGRPLQEEGRPCSYHRTRLGDNHAVICSDSGRTIKLLKTGKILRWYDLTNDPQELNALDSCPGGEELARRMESKLEAGRLGLAFY